MTVLAPHQFVALVWLVIFTVFVLKYVLLLCFEVWKMEGGKIFFLGMAAGIITVWSIVTVINIG